MSNLRKSVNSRVAVDVVHDNTSQEVIRTTADKLKIVLMEHLDKVEESKSWQTPLSLVIGIILVFASADFRSALTISADTWRAIFLVSLFLCSIWLIRSVIRFKKSPSISSIIAKIKNSD